MKLYLVLCAVFLFLFMIGGCQAVGDLLPATSGEMSSLGTRLQTLGATVGELGVAVEEDANGQVGIETVLTAAAGSTAVGGWLLNTIRNGTRKKALGEQERIRVLPEGQA